MPAHGDYLPTLAKEEEIKREAHAKGVNARAAGDQQARAGLPAIEVRQAQEP